MYTYIYIYIITYIGNAYDFNNPFVAMDVLSTWVLFQQGKAAERCRSKLLKPYQVLYCAVVCCSVLQCVLVCRSAVLSCSSLTRCHTVLQCVEVC